MATTKHIGAFSYTMDFDTDALASAAQYAGEKAAVAGGEMIRQRSTAIAPLRTSALIASVRVETRGLTTTVSYNVPYAAVQHEEVGYHHYNGRQAKYLSSVMSDPGVQDEIGKVFVANLGGK